MEDESFWMHVREGLLLIVDAIERRLKREPRTAELRKLVKQYERERRFDGWEGDRDDRQG